MKLSNNALNFLLAQYRAIFKRAYVKGLASAVLLTAGLAAGAASSPAMAGDIGPALDSGDFVSSSEVNSGTITQGSTIDMSSIDDTKFSGTWTFIGDTILSGQDADVSINGAVDKHIMVSGSSGDLTIQSGASLTLTNTDSTNTHIYGGNEQGSGGTLTVTGANSAIDLTKASMGFKDVKVNDGAELTLGGAVTNDAAGEGFNQGIWFVYTNISAVQDTSSSGGSFTVQNAKVTLNSQSFINAVTLNVSGGTTIDMNGELKDVETGSDYATAFLKAYGDNGTINVASTTENDITSKPVIHVAADKYGALYAQKINLTDTQVNIDTGATLFIDGVFSSVDNFSRFFFH